MTPASRTPEGEEHQCPVCGAVIVIEPSQTSSDAPCPRCGILLWFFEDRHQPTTNDAASRMLEARGVYITTDVDGEVTDIKFVGLAYDDSAVPLIARIEDVRTVDIRDTPITGIGAERLRELMPGVVIISE